MQFYFLPVLNNLFVDVVDNVLADKTIRKETFTEERSRIDAPFTAVVRSFSWLPFILCVVAR